jgi:hypothetical protein
MMSCDATTIDIVASVRREPSHKEVEEVGPEEEALGGEEEEEDGPQQQGEAGTHQEQPVKIQTCPVDARKTTPYDFVTDLREVARRRNASEAQMETLPAIVFVPGLYRRCPPKAGPGAEKRASLLDARTMCAILKDA